MVNNSDAVGVGDGDGDGDGDGQRWPTCRLREGDKMLDKSQLKEHQAEKRYF